jgi:chaperonin GroEL
MLLRSLLKKQFSTKNIYLGKDARSRLVQGCDIVSQTVEKTLGPGGRNVCVEYEVGSPKITKDGVTVAKNVLTTCNEVISIYKSGLKFRKTLE